ncbi:MAG: hypothetical protein AAB371_02430 [Patescibacteria group bacterium]
MVTITKNDIKLVVKESVREVLVAETMKLRALLVPYISNKEQKEIEKLYGVPVRQIAKRIKIKL